ncbi:MAG: SDR family oxidoreductase [Waddliaceae bacterium]
MNKKIVLITGSSRGIGRKTAIALAEQGHRVYASMRRPSPQTEFSEVSKESKQNIFVKTLDVIDKRSIEKTVEEIMEEAGRVDVVINNAGHGLLGPIELVTEKEIHEQFDVNVYGVIRVIQAVLPIMRRQKSGHVINISSIGGIVSNPFLGVYCATKHALEALSASLAATVFPWNIKVTVVQPAATATEFGKVLFQTEAGEGNPYRESCEQYRSELLDRLEEGQPPEEIADLIAEIIQLKHPRFRYQTNERGISLAKQFVTDPSGDDWLNAEKEKFHGQHRSHHQ